MSSTLDLMSLPDGRVLEYSVGGPPDGLPILSMHGLVGGATIDSEHEALCQAAGARVISVARPGYGRSTPSEVTPESNVATGVADFQALLSHLGVETYAVIAVSAGAPHGLALAATENPVHTTIVGGLPPVFDADVRAGYGMFARMIFATLCAPGGLGGTARALFTRFLLSSARRVLPGDPVLDESFAFEGAGVRRELQLQQRSWGFALEEAANVRWFHGELDTEVPLQAVRRGVGLLPQVTLEVVPGMAHFPTPAQWEDIYRKTVSFAQRRASIRPGGQPSTDTQGAEL